MKDCLLKKWVLVLKSEKHCSSLAVLKVQLLWTGNAFPGAAVASCSGVLRLAPDQDDSVLWAVASLRKPGLNACWGMHHRCSCPEQECPNPSLGARGCLEQASMQPMDKSIILQRQVGSSAPRTSRGYSEG